MSAAACRHCGAPVTGDGTCMKCLLGTGVSGGGQSLAERIFQAALSLDEDERAAFVAQATQGETSVLAEVQLLLAGYAEAGGDAAEATLGGTARERWAAVRREEPGTVIDHFRLVRIIGEGGMGSVWEAEQSAPIRRRVALKIIKLGMDTEEVVRRFERERRTLARMTHPHIAQVYAAGATPAGRPYFAMELVEGRAITAHCAAENPGIRERLGLFLEVCAAVEHAHQKGVIHRDLKPSNILVADGAVKVIDFGVAKATQDDGGDGLVTQQQQVLGTPAYMSPEQAESNGTDVDTRTDVYSLGVVLYELLSGTLPFDPERLAGTHLREVQRILREEAPPRPSTRVAPQRGSVRPGTPEMPHPARSEISGDLDWVVMKALSKERERRYASAADFAADVRRFLEGSAVSAVPPTLSYRSGKFIRRNKAAVAAVAGIMLALAAGLIVSLRQVQRTNEALAGEAEARQAATFTVADMYARSGLTAGESGDPTRAALWFANAAIIGAGDPARVDANRRRAETWRRESMPAVAAMDTGFSHLASLVWHPRLPVLLVESEGLAAAAQVWNVEREELWRPDLGMEHAAWSPTGEWLAAVLPGGVVAVLEYPSGREVARFFPGSSALAWSPDGRWIAAGNGIHDWRAGVVRPLPAGGKVRFSRDGRLLLLHWESLAGVCSLENPGEFLHAPVPSQVNDLPDFLGDGQRYLVSTAEHGLCVRDSLTGELLDTLPFTTRSLESPAVASVTADGRFAACTHHPAVDLVRRQSLVFPLHEGALKAVAFKAVAFSPDGSRLVSGGYDNRMELWSVPDGRFLGTIGHHLEAVTNVAYSADGQFVASGEGGLVRVWDTRLPAPVRYLPTDSFSLATVSGDGRLVAASGFTHRGAEIRQTRACHLPGGEPAGPVIAPGGVIMDAVFSQDGSWLALAVATTPGRSQFTYETGGGSGNIQFWDPRSGERLGEPVPVPSEPRGLCLHPSGEWLGVYTSGEGLEIHTVSRQIRPCFQNHRFSDATSTLANGRCAYSPDGRIFAAWGNSGNIHLWDRAAGRDLIPPGQSDRDAYDAALTDSTAAFAIMMLADGSTHLEFHNLRPGGPRVPDIPSTGWPYRTQFHPDGGLLLSAGGGKTAQVWDWRSGRLVCPALPHAEAIMAGTFVPGTPWVITGGHDSRIRFWDTRTGMMIRPPLVCSGAVISLQVTPDARTLIANGYFSQPIELHDLAALLPAPDLSPDLLKLRAEIDADATVHPGGGLAPLTTAAWLEKWRTLRAMSR